jgi:hypothetical protein
MRDEVLKEEEVVVEKRGFIWKLMGCEFILWKF